MEYLILEKLPTYFEFSSPYTYVKSRDGRLNTLRQFLEDEFHEDYMPYYREIIEGDTGLQMGQHTSATREGAYVELSVCCDMSEDLDSANPIFLIDPRNFLQILQRWAEVVRDSPQTVRFVYDGSWVTIEVVTPDKVRICREVKHRRR